MMGTLGTVADGWSVGGPSASAWAVLLPHVRHDDTDELPQEAVLQIGAAICCSFTVGPQVPECAPAWTVRLSGEKGLLGGGGSPDTGLKCALD